MLRYYPAAAQRKLGSPWVGPQQVVRQATGHTCGIHKGPDTPIIFIHVDDLKTCPAPADAGRTPGPSTAKSSVKRPEQPCLCSVNRSPVIFSFCAWTPRYRTMPELETDHPQKYLTSQVTSIERLERPCMGSLNRSPVIYSFCIWTLRHRTMPKLDTDRPQKYPQKYRK